MFKQIKVVILCLYFQGLLIESDAKYVSGHLKTLEDWSFLARFCFISGRGKYEYEIEFDRRYGEPQLLLYYDDKSQWPSVYKSGKTCRDKLSVLSIHDNQIVTLSARSPLNGLSGCTILPKENPKPFSSIPEATSESPIYEPTEGHDDENHSTETNYDKYLKRPLSEPKQPSGNRTVKSLENITDEPNNEFAESLESFNETEIFNNSATTGDEHSHNGGGLTFQHDIGMQNELENTTEWKLEVEQLFETQNQTEYLREDTKNYKSRERRSENWPFRRQRDTYIVRCHNAGTFISSRERWWYIAISNCGSDKGLDIRYRFKMTNGKSGDFWNEHFSADERLIPLILLIEFIAYSLLMVALFFCTVELKSLHLYHCTYRLFGTSMVVQYMGVVISGISWIRYGLTGLGPHTTIGNLFASASEISYLLLLLLMAKGYTITRARLSSCSIVKLTIFINSYIVCYIILFVYQAEAFDPGEVLNLYESPAGFGLSMLRCVSWLVFMISTGTTIRKYPEKSSFYYPFGMLGSLWVLGGPFLTVVGIGVLDAWVRESVMCGTFAMLAFSGHFAFLWLTWPSRANKSFPYHVKTNHVGIASEDDDGADYPRHTYEPTHINENIIIPLSRRTEELINGIYGQYVHEHERTDKNVHRHASFPFDPNAPPEILSSNQLDGELYNNELNNRLTNYAQNQMTAGNISQPQSCTLVDGYEDENQVDSGHPSLEHSRSPSNSNNTTKSVSDTESPKKDLELRKDSVVSIKSGRSIDDPTRPAPNKIILEPIERSLQSMKLPAVVPKHLFVAKRSGDEIKNESANENT